MGQSPRQVTTILTQGEVQIHPDDESVYRILGGAHRFTAYKGIGATVIEVRIITLDGVDPLLYAAKKAIGPLQLDEEEARDTARRAYENNPRLMSVEIGRAVGRSRAGCRHLCC